MTSTPVRNHPSATNTEVQNARKLLGALKFRVDIPTLEKSMTALSVFAWKKVAVEGFAPPPSDNTSPVWYPSAKEDYFPSTYRLVATREIAANELITIYPAEFVTPDDGETFVRLNTGRYDSEVPAGPVTDKKMLQQLRAYGKHMGVGCCGYTYIPSFERDSDPTYMGQFARGPFESCDELIGLIKDCHYLQTAKDMQSIDETFVQLQKARCNAALVRHSDWVVPFLFSTRNIALGEEIRLEAHLLLSYVSVACSEAGRNSDLGMTPKRFERWVQSFHIQQEIAARNRAEAAKATSKARIEASAAALAAKPARKQRGEQQTGGGGTEDASAIASTSGAAATVISEKTPEAVPSAETRHGEAVEAIAVVTEKNDAAKDSNSSAPPPSPPATESSPPLRSSAVLSTPPQ